jgi:hypothetical protein
LGFAVIVWILPVLTFLGRKFKQKPFFAWTDFPDFCLDFTWILFDKGLGGNEQKIVQIEQKMGKTEQKEFFTVDSNNI